MRHINQVLAASCLAIALSAMTGVHPASGAQPATEPANDSGGVLVLPFTPLNQSEYQPWLGRSIQQSMMAELTMAAPGRASASDTPAADDKAALAAGRNAGVRYVVYGSFATANQELRATGQVVDVAAGKSIAGLKATGPTKDVFQLEDLLARQVRRRLSITLPGQQGQSPPVATEVPAPHALEFPQQPAKNEYEQTYGNQPPVQYQTNYNSYYYGNPSSGFGYPGFGNGWGDSFWGTGLSSGFGFPFGLGFGDLGFPFQFRGHSHHHRGDNNNSDLNWNGSFAAGIANTREGTPLGGVGTFPSSGFGGQFGSAGNFHTSHVVSSRSTRGAGAGGAHSVSGHPAAKGHR
jgi:TolB-like protein